MTKRDALIDAARKLFHLVDEVSAIEPRSYAAIDAKRVREAELVRAWTVVHGPLGLALRDVVAITLPRRGIGLPPIGDETPFFEQRRTWFYGGEWRWLEDGNPALLVRQSDVVAAGVLMVTPDGPRSADLGGLTRAFPGSSRAPMPFTDAWWLGMHEPVAAFLKAGKALKALHDGLQRDADADSALSARAFAVEVLEARRQVLMADGSLRFAGKTLFDCIGGALIDEATGANRLRRCICGEYFRAVPSTKEFHDDNCEQKHRKRRWRTLASAAEKLLETHGAVDARRLLPKRIDNHDVTRADRKIAVQAGRALAAHRAGAPWSTIAARLHVDVADVTRWLGQWCGLEEKRARRPSRKTSRRAAV